jgi:uncharacterized protein YjeT (DUF2065 family)
MIEALLWGLGLVLVIEGLVYALAPSAIERLFEAYRSLTIDQRRAMGLVSVALGVGLCWLARQMGV